jgi:hypothetical protein
MQDHAICNCTQYCHERRCLSKGEGVFMHVEHSTATFSRAKYHFLSIGVVPQCTP